MKRIYFSDVHMNVNKSNQGSNEYVWLSEAKRNSFQSFLEYLATNDDVREIIMVGDILDTWVCPIDVEPPTYRDILGDSSNAGIVQALQKLDGMPTKELIYLPGNHDMTVDKKTVKEFFPNMVFGGNQMAGVLYVADSSVAEHGTSSAMFNGPDPESDPVSSLPLGYFISRVAATAKARNATDIKIVKRILEAFATFILKKDTLGDRVFDTVLAYAGLNQNEEIVMPGGSKLTFNDVRARYADIYHRWEAGKHLLNANDAIAADTTGLAVMVTPLSEKNNAKIVILGHTHVETNSPIPPIPSGDPLPDEVDCLYENCGCWCNQDDKNYFVETEVKDDRNYVRMMTWKDGQAAQDGNTFYVKL